MAFFRFVQNRSYMKYIFLLALLSAGIAGCHDTDAATTSAKVDGVTTIQWIDSVKNYGRINEGQQLQVSFRFKNTGDKPLVIEKVQPSCGCTAAAPPEKPILPGEEGEIKATFNSENRVGMNSKDITVFANTPEGGTHRLHFDVEVVKMQ